MKVIKTIELGRNEKNDCIIAEIVDDVSIEERKEFEEYEIVEEYDLTQNEKQQLGDLIKRYLKSYSKHKNKMSLEQWLVMMFKEDMPDKPILEIISLAKSTIAGVEKNYELKKKIKHDMDMGLDYSDYFIKDIIRDEEFQKLPDKRGALVELDNALTKQGAEQLYTLAEVDKDVVIENFTDSTTSPNVIESLGKGLGNASIDRYFTNIQTTIDKGNEEMWNATHTLAGNPNMNPNLDGFIAEQSHVNSFNIDAAVKGIKNVEAQVLTPEGAYGKNSVDIVIKEVKNGTTKIIKKYQAKFCKDATATEDAFYDQDGYKYPFQGKLTPKEQAEQIKNSVDRIEANGIQSKSLTKEEVKNMQHEVQNENQDAVNMDFSNVDTSLLLKRIGIKAVRNTVMAGATAMVFNVGKKIITGEKVDGDEVIAESLKTGGTVGVSTVVAGALRTASEKGITKGILKNQNVISAIAFSAIDCLGALYRIGSGECSFSEGMGDIGASLTTAYLTTKSFFLGKLAFATVTSMVAAPAAIVTVGGVIAATTVVVAGTTVAGAIGSAAKKVVSGTVSLAKSVVSAGVNAVKSVASAACNVVKSVASAACNVVKSFCSSVCGFFGW